MESIIRKLKKARAKKVLLQVPEGLKTKVLDMAAQMEGGGISVLISVDTCFGACDLRDREAKALGCDALVHMGHSDFGLKMAVPVVYDEFRTDFDPVNVLRSGLKKLADFRRIGIVTTAQHLDSIRKAKAYLEREEKRVLIGKSRRLNPSQIIGCDYSAAKSIERDVDCFLFIGSGRFHALGLIEATSKTVFFLDIESRQLTDISSERSKLEIKRALRIEKAKGGMRFGILVSTKPGQMGTEAAERIKQKLKKAGRDAWILVADQIAPEKLMGLKIDCLVNTACPRIAEDSVNLGILVVNSEDVDRILSDK